MLKIEYIKFLQDKNEHDLLQKKKLQDLHEKLSSVDTERMFWLEKVELLETEYENQFKEMRDTH